MMDLRAAVLLLAAALSACTTQSPLRYDFDGDGVLDADDCQPADADAYAGAPDPYGDGQDTNCDGADGVDADGDSYPGNVDEDEPFHDCNDASAEQRPGAPEVQDGLDNDCDGLVDEGSEVSDDDGDGFCEALIGPCLGLAQPGDCDDTDPALNPGDGDGDGVSTCDAIPDCDDNDPSSSPDAPELCNLRDDDCDGLLPGDEVDADFDGDPACATDCDDGDPNVHGLDDDGDGQSLCDQPADCDDAAPLVVASDGDGDGIADCDGDCDDTRADVGPQQVEVCDGVDTNCDGLLGPGELDGDGDGDPACSDCADGDASRDSLDADGDGQSTCTLDCDDADAARFPGAVDAPGDGLDANCDGVDGVDLDGDGDPQGLDCDDSSALMNLSDSDGDGATSCGGDCDDADPGLNLLDADGDGYATCSADCDDADPARTPVALEVCDLIDNNCDGVQDPLEIDADGDGDPACSDCDDTASALHTLDADGDSWSICTGDCDDADNNTLPTGLDPFGDGADTNCDGADGVDTDQDGFASLASGGADCADLDPTVHPAATEQAGDGIDSNCDGDDGVDADGDGYAAVAGGGRDCDDTDPTIHPGFIEPLAADGADANCDGTDGNLFARFSGYVNDGTANHGTSQAICDLDGDGVGDLVIGSPFEGVTSDDFQEGTVSIFYGPFVGPRPKAGADVVLVGQAWHGWLGYSVACGGDTDGDGLQELIVGAPGELGSLGSQGGVYIVEPPAAGEVPLDLWSEPRIESTDVVPGALFGQTVAGGGDFDGDGLDDVVIATGVVFEPPGLVGLDPMDYEAGVGGQGMVHVLSGPIVGLVDAATAAVAVYATDPTEASGSDRGLGFVRPIAVAGDVDGDGLDDLLVGEAGLQVATDAGGAPMGLSGAVRLFSGPLPPVMNGATCTATILGVQSSQGIGESVIGLGDLDGDGDAEIAVTGADNFYGSDPLGAWIFEGPVVGVLDVTAADAHLTDDGGAPVNGVFRSTVASAGDVDGDGVIDLLFTGIRIWDYSVDYVDFWSQAWLVPGPVFGVVGVGPSTALLLGAEPVTFVGAPNVYLWALPALDMTGDGRSDPAWAVRGDSWVGAPFSNSVKFLPNPNEF